jgi:hypothetical protein
LITRGYAREVCEWGSERRTHSHNHPHTARARSAFGRCFSRPPGRAGESSRVRNHEIRATQNHATQTSEEKRTSPRTLRTRSQSLTNSGLLNWEEEEAVTPSFVRKRATRRESRQRTQEEEALAECMRTQRDTNNHATPQVHTCSSFFTKSRQCAPRQSTHAQRKRGGAFQRTSAPTCQRSTTKGLPRFRR